MSLCVNRPRKDFLKLVLHPGLDPSKAEEEEQKVTHQQERHIPQEAEGAWQSPAGGSGGGGGSSGVEATSRELPQVATAVSTAGVESAVQG
ncbi:hypothetical protein Y1Q_0001338 [Alligator mississippiensis]|uniref:Uncharacterized protein n=1 Tax=Alligator mississippiensis TaxID=8496 RepID=A0A151M937_ALLMI|nr:hypothetical protein Y1Q_0001338 [Alligator mississippiensis]